jgi:hypothetical protein
MYAYYQFRYYKIYYVYVTLMEVLVPTGQRDK